ncbi:MAG TPA: hypothetical protein VMU71_03255 [Terracidiphilus sp.]|nr:hypothetical protein [Terracidiphilus sp.]
MMGHGKDCRYELHHPMSIGDVLAALFRGKPKEPGAGAKLFGLGQSAEAAPAVPVSKNEQDEASVAPSS